MPLKMGFPRLYAAASLKPRRPRAHCWGDGAFSAALCRGLIEASAPARPGWGAGTRFPRLYAAASLKPSPLAVLGQMAVPFSAALCRGLIEALRIVERHIPGDLFSAALCRGLIEAD